MKSLVFDSSTIITLALNNLLAIFHNLRREFNGTFYITQEVKKEIIDAPLKTQRFKLEALQIMNEIIDGSFTIYPESLDSFSLLELSNSIYKINNHYLKILDKGEIESLLLAIKLDTILVVDERTLRMLIESPQELRKLLERKFHKPIYLESENLKRFKKAASNVRILRSSELMIIAYEKGLLNSYLKKDNLTNLDLRKELITGLLWGLKLKGCAISEKEIKDLEFLVK